MQRCPLCRGEIETRHARFPDGMPYDYRACNSCGEEFLEMSQLEDVALRYRRWKRYRVKVSKWGGSLGIRIPKELATKYGIKDAAEVHLLPEKEGIRIQA